MIDPVVTLKRSSTTQGWKVRLPSHTSYKTAGSWGCGTTILSDINADLISASFLTDDTVNSRRFTSLYPNHRSGYFGFNQNMPYECLKEALDLSSIEMSDQAHKAMVDNIVTTADKYLVVFSGMVNGTKGLQSANSRGNWGAGGLAEYLVRRGEAVTASPVLHNHYHPTPTDFSLRRVWLWYPSISTSSHHIRGTEYHANIDKSPKFAEFPDWKTKIAEKLKAYKLEPYLEQMEITDLRG